MESHHTSRRRVNLTLPQSLLDEAKKIDLNLSHAAEAGISAAVKKAKEEAWLKENQKAIEAYNQWYEERGPLLRPSWMPE